jgi:ubiquinone/menaquinone biosynthesis C-methylase UbiE
VNSTDNTIPIEAWNTVLFEKFYRFRHVMTTGLAGHSDEFFRRHSYAPGSCVLDVGCGFGETTLQIAQQVTRTGSVAGVDCAGNVIDIAGAEARSGDVVNAHYFAADVQSEDLLGPYDHAFSRFGTMFFNLPGAALRNIRRALKPGGTFSMIIWRKREDNPWMHEAELLVREMVPVVSHEETDQVHCGPGPFSMAGADLVSDMMRGAGYDRISFERYDTKISIGRTVDEAVEFAIALGPAGEIIRLAGEEGQKRKPQVVDALQKLFRASLCSDGVWLDSSSWFVTARNPV